MRTSCRTVAVHVALAAMLLRALVPAGWMPSGDSANGAPLMLCPGETPAMEAMPQMASMPGMVHDVPAAPAHMPSHAASLCIFAAAAHLSPPSFAAAFSQPVSLLADIGFATPREDAKRFVAYRPNAARAPPPLA